LKGVGNYISAHKRPYELAQAYFEIPDPGTGQAINYNKWGTVVPFTIAASATETNTLAAPLNANQRIVMFALSVGASGTRTVTVASAINIAGDTTIKFDAVDDYCILTSVPVGSGVFEWRVESADGVTNTSGTSLSQSLTGISATAAEIDRAADASARIVNVAATATALTVTATEHGERVIILPIITSAGLTITLPAATGTGVRYKIVNPVVQTVSVTVTALAGDLMVGKAVGHHLTAGASDLFYPDASDDVKWTFNITTTGGDGGDIVDLMDIATDRWLTDISFTGSGTLATGFA
jgi:hypothetical protein